MYLPFEPFIVVVIYEAFITPTRVVTPTPQFELLWWKGEPTLPYVYTTHFDYSWEEFGAYIPPNCDLWRTIQWALELVNCYWLLFYCLIQWLMALGWNGVTMRAHQVMTIWLLLLYMVNIYCVPSIYDLGRKILLLWLYMDLWKQCVGCVWQPHLYISSPRLLTPIIICSHAMCMPGCDVCFIIIFLLSQAQQFKWLLETWLPNLEVAVLLLFQCVSCVTVRLWHLNDILLGRKA